MNRRTLLATFASIVGLGGCYQVATGDNQDQSSGQETTEDQAQEQEPSINGEDVGSTDTAPEDRNETTPSTEDNQSGKQESTDENVDEDSNASGADQPDTDPLRAIEIISHEMVYSEAADPQYETDDLYLAGQIQNNAEYPVGDVRLDGYAKDGSDEEIGHEYIEYAEVEAGGIRSFELPFVVENPAAAEEYDLEVTSAEFV